jgi:hypothetical protein
MPKEMVCHNPMVYYGGRGQIKGLRFYPILCVKQSGSLKEVTPVMESKPTQ